MSQDWRDKLAEMASDIEAKNLNLAKSEEDLKLSQQKREALTQEMTDIREEIESAQRRVEELLQEKDGLEKELRLKQTEIEVLRLKNSSIASIKEQEIANFQKQLETVRQELEEEKKKLSPLQVEVQRKRVEVAEKMKDIQYLTEARDRANSELERAISWARTLFPAFNRAWTMIDHLASKQLSNHHWSITLLHSSTPWLSALIIDSL